MSFTDSLDAGGWAAVIALGLVCAAILFWLALRAPLRWLLAACLAISMLQVFGPFGFMSLSLFALAGLLPGVVIRTRQHGRQAWPLLLAALAVWQTLSVAWSATVGSAAYGVLTSCALLTCYLLARAPSTGPRRPRLRRSRRVAVRGARGAAGDLLPPVARC